MSTGLAKLAWPACVSAFQLDRFLQEELDKPEADELSAHLASCARCTGALQGLRLERNQAQLPPLRAARAQPARRPWRLRSALGAGLAAAAALLLFLRPAAQTEHRKGGQVALAMYVQHGDEVRRVGPGDQVAPGDAVRFAVTTPVKAFVAVLSIDPGGRASVYFPLGARAEEVAGGAEFALPLGTRLDKTAGQERLIGLFCDSPVELEPLRASLEGGAALVPAGCQVTRWSFVKR